MSTLTGAEIGVGIGVGIAPETGVGNGVYPGVDAGVCALSVCIDSSLTPYIEVSNGYNYSVSFISTSWFC